MGLLPKRPKPAGYAPASRDGRTSLWHIEDEDGGDPLPDETSSECRYRDGAARTRLQSHPRNEHHGHPAADGRDPSIAKLEKWLVYCLAQFKSLLAKRFETTKTRSGHGEPTSYTLPSVVNCRDRKST